VGILPLARLSVINLVLLVTSWLVSGFLAIVAVAFSLFNVLAEANFISAIFEVTLMVAVSFLPILAVDVRLSVIFDVVILFCAAPEVAIFTVILLIVVAILVFDTDLVPALAVTALAGLDTLSSDTLLAIMSSSVIIRPFFVRLVRFANVGADCVFETASSPGRTDDNAKIVAALLLTGSIFLSDSDIVVLNKQISVSLN
jgi:signal transduction histidine kinase